MVELTKEDILNIHRELEKRFPTMTQGVMHEGLLDSIAKRPSQDVYKLTPFPNIYSKCASVLEAIIRWHTFYDGNKRTGLAAATAYMYKNNLRLVIPINAVRFSVLIADKSKNVPFDQIEEWVQVHTAHNLEELKSLVKLDVQDQAMNVLRLLHSTDQAKVKEGIDRLNHWLAVDIYREYEMELNETLQFLANLITRYPLEEF